MARSESDAQTALVELKKSMECPVCLVLPRKAPVYQCQRGHCVCSACKEKLTNCPICQIPLGNIRNLIYEEILTKMTHNCKFADQGCSFVETTAPLELHEKECQYGQVNCPSLRCKVKVSLANLLEHIEQAGHETEPFVMDAIKIPCSGVRVRVISSLAVFEADFTRKFASWIPGRIDLHGKHFFLERWRTEDGQWHSFVYMMGTKEECAKFLYTVRFFPEGNKKQGAIFCGPCVPLDLTKEEVVELGNCLTFSDATAKRFWADDEIPYEVTIEEADK